MKSRLQPVLAIKQGEIGRQKAGELSRMLQRKLLNDPAFLAQVEARMKQKEAEQAKAEQTESE